MVSGFMALIGSGRSTVNKRGSLELIQIVCQNKEAGDSRKISLLKYDDNWVTESSTLGRCTWQKGLHKWCCNLLTTWKRKRSEIERLWGEKKRVIVDTGFFLENNKSSMFYHYFVEGNWDNLHALTAPYCFSQGP